MASGKRQIFHAEIGRGLAKLREERDLSQGQVAHRTKGKISEGTLKSLETGRIKNPDPDHLRALAALYDVPFRVIAEPFVLANYGPDLTRQVGDQQSSQEGAQANVPAEASVELRQLRETRDRYDAEVQKMRTLADDIYQAAIALEKIRKAAARAPGRSRHDRKVG